MRPAVAQRLDHTFQRLVRFVDLLRLRRSHTLGTTLSDTLGSRKIYQVQSSVLDLVLTRDLVQLSRSHVECKDKVRSTALLVHFRRTDFSLRLGMLQHVKNLVGRLYEDLCFWFWFVDV